MAELVVFLRVVAAVILVSGSVGFGGGDATAPAKQSVQVWQMVVAVDSMEERVMEVLAQLTTKIDNIDVIAKHLGGD